LSKKKKGRRAKYEKRKKGLDESVNKINELFGVLRVQGVSKCFKVNVKKTITQRLEISEDKKMTLGKQKIDQVDSFTYLGALLVNTVGAVKMLKVE